MLTNSKSGQTLIAKWLFLGVIMILIQVLLGGITRLTESGLSITEWKPITGMLPPLDEASWQLEFDKYRNTDQFKYVHAHFSLKEFKWIFFWEWFHRVWARTMGLVFLFGFIYFLIKKQFDKRMVTPMIILFILGGIQGAIGWIMVKSGLVPEMYYVGHVELTTHFIAALVLLVYTAWFGFRLLPAFEQKISDEKLRNGFLLFVLFFIVQLIYGGFMAGMKAAATAPTWPYIQGALIPDGWMEQSPGWMNLIYNPLTVQFIHRSIAYLLFALGLYLFFKSKHHNTHPIFGKLRLVFVGLLGTQVLLGIFALLTATSPDTFIYLGVAHQFVAMLLALNLTGMIYLLRIKTNG
jgi:cytochrome c oxidase assembly protein subunit 15